MYYMLLEILFCIVKNFIIYVETVQFQSIHEICKIVFISVEIFEIRQTYVDLVTYTS